MSFCRMKPAMALTGSPFERAIAIGASDAWPTSYSPLPTICTVATDPLPSSTTTSRPCLANSPFCAAKWIALCEPQGVQSRRTAMRSAAAAGPTITDRKNATIAATACPVPLEAGQRVDLLADALSDVAGDVLSDVLSDVSSDASSRRRTGAQVAGTCASHGEQDMVSPSVLVCSGSSKLSQQQRRARYDRILINLAWPTDAAATELPPARLEFDRTMIYKFAAMAPTLRR